MSLRKIAHVPPSSYFLAWITRQSIHEVYDKSQFKNKSCWHHRFLKSPSHSQLFLPDATVLRRGSGTPKRCLPGPPSVKTHYHQRIASKTLECFQMWEDGLAVAIPWEQTSNGNCCSRPRSVRESDLDLTNLGTSRKKECPPKQQPRKTVETCLLRIASQNNRACWPGRVSSVCAAVSQ